MPFLLKRYRKGEAYGDFRGGGRVFYAGRSVYVAFAALFFGCHIFGGGTVYLLQAEDFQNRRRMPITLPLRLKGAQLSWLRIFWKRRII